MSAHSGVSFKVNVGVAAEVEGGKVKGALCGFCTVLEASRWLMLAVPIIELMLAPLVSGAEEREALR